MKKIVGAIAATVILASNCGIAFAAAAPKKPPVVKHHPIKHPRHKH